MVDEVTPQSDFYNNYGTWYKGIRKANLVLERIKNVRILLRAICVTLWDVVIS